MVALKELVPAPSAIISGHEIEELEHTAPQLQAGRLLERAINHYDGAAELIERSIDRWRGKIAMEGRLNAVFTTAMNANDLRVRAAGHHRRALAQRAAAPCVRHSIIRRRFFGGWIEDSPVTLPA